MCRNYLLLLDGPPTPFYSFYASHASPIKSAWSGWRFMFLFMVIAVLLFGNSILSQHLRIKVLSANRNLKLFYAFVYSVIQYFDTVVTSHAPCSN